MAIKASVFIPTSKSSKLLTSCLKSLENQSSEDFEVIIVGVKENQNILKTILKFKKLHINYFIQKTQGLVGAANEALKKAEGDIFIRIDDDVTVSKNWLKNILINFIDNSKIGGVTGPTLINEESLQSRDSLNIIFKFKKSNNPVLKILDKIYTSYLCENRLFEVGRFLKSGNFTIGANFINCLKIKTQEVENFEACNFACKTLLLKKLGGFDHAFIKGLGDYHEADMACKIRKSGYKIIFNPKAKLWHHIELGQNMESRPDSYNRIKNFIIFYRRHMKINNLDTLLRFFTNILFQNGYYLYKFICTKKISHLGAIPGTIAGLLGI